MLKNVLGILVVGMLLAVSARGVVLFEEDFAGTVGADLTTIGWTNEEGPDAGTISDTDIGGGDRSGRFYDTAASTYTV